MDYGKIIKEKIDFLKYVNSDYSKIDPYLSFNDIPSKLPNIECKTREPEFLNPNGYNNIIQVFNKRNRVEKRYQAIQHWRTRMAVC